MAIDGVLRGLRRLGHQVHLRPLRIRTRVHTLDRWIYNRAVLRQPPTAEIVIGVDLDGYRWGARRPGHVRYAVMLKGIIADELRNERGLVRASLALQARWEAANVATADRVLVPSRYSAAMAEQVYGVDAGRIRVVPEPLDVAEWRRRFAAVPGRTRRVPTVLAVARMYPRKRLDDLLQATAQVRPRIPGLRVRIVGDGPEWSRLHGLAHTLDLGDTVTFLGAIGRQDLAAEYVGADVFCLPTVQEGFGIAFTEAMAAGLPIVACRAAAVPEVVEDGHTGLLVGPRRPGEVASALERLLRDSSLRARLGAAGRKRVEMLDLPAVAGRVLEALA